jgi:alcohol/geraniol dehydrogenase (NADP+)
MAINQSGTESIDDPPRSGEMSRAHPSDARLGPRAVRSYAGWVAHAARQPMRREILDLGSLDAEDVEVAVDYCGLCHSDLSVLNDAWGNAQFPAVLGHEITGTITAIGSATKGLAVGQRVGIGWMSGSCMHCQQCMSGSHHLCPRGQLTVVGHHGGFATHVRTHWAWAIPLPDALDAAEAGPLLCGGVTVFAPLVMYGKPTDRVGILGIGGLGHLAVQFASAYGCEVTAFTSSENKFEEAKRFGATQVVSSNDAAAIRKLEGSFDLLISTVNVNLDWTALTSALAPNGRMHLVGAVLEPLPVAVPALISRQRSVSGSPTGSPTMIARMLDFASRHGVLPQTEHFPMSDVNAAISRLASGKARYRIVLDSDF